MRVIYDCSLPDEDDLEKVCNNCECRFSWSEIGWDYEYGDEVGYYVQGYEVICPMCGISLEEQEAMEEDDDDDDYDNEEE